MTAMHSDLNCSWQPGLKNAPLLPSGEDSRRHPVMPKINILALMDFSLSFIYLDSKAEIIYLNFPKRITECVSCWFLTTNTPVTQHRRDLELLERVQGRHQDDQRDGAALLGGKAGRAGIVQPGEEKLWGDPTVASQCLKELTRKVERDLGQGME
ncbi:hypothetical protein DUI87_11919 [Hirundo rustica rustica]|uniref:Uncharacterized protein n=1 Tax=Hirundo rustica rustica TaxID=333673 RepID=A0A3M0KF25_HIRRU|nr:hypothetical protein DUI87_11919 [Hirundo rustica rustica]